MEPQEAGAALRGQLGEPLSFAGFSTMFLLEKDKMIVLAFPYPI